MAVKDMRIVLGGVELPKYTGFNPGTEENAVDVVTAGGSLYTDFINRRESWTFTWENLTSEDYDTIKAIYDDQFVDPFQYPDLQVDALSVYTRAKMSIPPKHQLRWNGSIIQNFFIELQAQHAVS